MNGRNEFSHEVPIVILDDIPQIQSPISIDEMDDQDCTIIEPESTEKTSLHPNLNKKTNPLKNHTKDAIIIDEDSEKDNDCTIIETQINSENNQFTSVNMNKSFQENNNPLLAKSLAKHHNNSTNKPEKPQESNSHNSNNQLINHIEESIDPIVLDEDSERENDCSIIRIVSQENQSKNNKTSKSSYFDEIRRRDKVLAALIEKCLDMENSTGMLRIINRTLIPIYNDTSDDFKQSDYFQRILTKTLEKLETEPNKKFLHLKGFCEVMKNGLPTAPKNFSKERETTSCNNVKEKKRVQLTTLKRKLNGKFTTNKTKSSGTTIPEKKSKPDVIYLDDDDDDVIANDTGFQINDVRCKAVETTSDQIASINKNHTEITHTVDDNDVEINDHKTNERKTDDEINECNKIEDDVILIEDDNRNSNKENITVTPEQYKHTTISDVPYKECAKKKQNEYITNNTSGIDLYNNEEITTINNLVKPVDLPIPSHVTIAPENHIKSKIEDLELRIKTYNQLIEQLEIKEVDWDTNDNNSSYIQSEHYKSRVVSLYKELCALTGSESVKQHKVRLKVLEGRHEGPIRCLQEFINGNIDEDGNPPFPDMLDVTNCVSEANIMYQLGWSKRQIEMEALTLFIHYGRTVQKKRQKREWRHLMRYVKEEIIDPADKDSTLQARLEENAKLASKNEMDLLDRYAQMEYLNAHSVASTNSSKSDHEREIGETSTARNDTLSYNETVSNIATVSNSATISNSGNVPNIATIVDSEILPNNTTILNNVTAPNNCILNSNKESSSLPTDNIMIFDPSDIAVQELFIPQEAVNYPIKYIVVDGNMQPLGIITKPQQNLTLEEALNSKDPTNIMINNTNNACDEPNSINKVDSTVPQNVGNDKIEITNQDDLKPNLQDLFSVENNDITANSTANTFKENKQNYEHFESHTEINIKPNISDIEVTKSVQYNDVSTNSDADITTYVQDKNVSENTEVSTSTEACTKTCELVNTRSEIGDNACELVNIRGSTEIGDKTCEAVNGAASPEDGDKSCRLMDDSQSIQDGIKSFELVNIAESTDIRDKTCELVNDSQPIEQRRKSCDVVNDTGLTVGDQTCELVNDSQPIEQRSKPCDVVNDTGLTVGDKTCELVNDTGSSNTDPNEIIVKKEKLDIPQMLEALGDNYTVTILSIEDPFEIIEISDSSDSEDDL